MIIYVQLFINILLFILNYNIFIISNLTFIAAVLVFKYFL